MKTNKGRYNFTLSDEMKKLLKLLADEMRRSESNTLEVLIEEEAKRRKLTK